MAIVAKKIQDSKVQAIAATKQVFSGKEGSTNDYIFTEYRGLTVEQITALRKQLRAKEATYKVVKNNYARIAFEELQAPKEIANYLIGPSAVAVASKDSNEIAKILTDFAKETPALLIKGGMVGGSVYDAKQIAAFSKLPGRLQLISMLMSCMKAPSQNLALALNDIPSRLVRTVKAVADKKAAEGK
ncbi:MAG: 50S ribosomal protein L10 [Termitinemataceae bacterium]|nr:MAG: 50S ribosomal protein L10 [Termitinemataceae bacterium]